MKGIRKRVSRDNMRKGVYVLPNLFTTASMLCGFISMISAWEGAFQQAATFIVVAMILDGLDGRIARVTKTESKFGAEYDSLADVIAFGVAPAVMVYKWSLEAYGNWGIMASFLLLACGALRLARFNVQIGVIDSRFFNGLPIPMQAVFTAVGVLLYYKLGFTGTFPHPFVFTTVIFLALLMVSSIKFYSFKDLNFFARKPLMSLVLIIITLAIIILEPQITLFVFGCGYVASGPIYLFIKLARKYILKQEEVTQSLHN
ncbi:MAG: CDP-diacylglycerol--serine O-phosphatidyltransferase [Deltaproteobacteria bacterium]|nr:CDP-diacylglycerol--serine O-phosphatidyltransferase [Deltaproteobacteria bacterium]